MHGLMAMEYGVINYEFILIVLTRSIYKKYSTQADGKGQPKGRKFKRSREKRPFIILKYQTIIRAQLRTIIILNQVVDLYLFVYEI